MRKGVFFSYALADQHWANNLKVHLNARQEELRIQIWDTADLPAGENLPAAKAEIFQKIKIVIVLLSASYFTSDEAQKDWTQLVQLANDSDVVILPIFANPINVPENHTLTNFQSLNADSNSLAKMEEVDFHNFCGYVGKRIKHILKDELEKEIAVLEDSGKDDFSLKKEIEKNLEQLETSISQDEKEVKSALRLSLAKICVISILKRVTPEQNPNGLRMKIINERSKTKLRKYIFQSLDELEKWGYVEKTRMGKETYWKLSGKGLDFSQEIDSSFLFDEYA